MRLLQPKAALRPNEERLSHPKKKLALQSPNQQTQKKLFRMKKTEKQQQQNCITLPKPTKK